MVPRRDNKNYYKCRSQSLAFLFCDFEELLSTSNFHFYRYKTTLFVVVLLKHACAPSIFGSYCYPIFSQSTFCLHKMADFKAKFLYWFICSAGFPFARNILLSKFFALMSLNCERSSRTDLFGWS
jgi:hypothetical protein